MADSYSADADGQTQAGVLRERGQVGIGTLIIFVTMILIASMAAGILLETTDLFEQQAAETGQESSDRLKNQLEVVTVTGSNITDTEPHRIERVEVIVRGATDDGNVDLENVTVEWISDGSGFTLVSENQSGGAGTDTFATKSYSDIDDTFPVLTDSDDRYALVFEPGDTFGSAGLDEGERVTLVLSTPAGSTRTVAFRVPDVLDNKDSVEL